MILVCFSFLENGSAVGVGCRGIDLFDSWSSLCWSCQTCFGVSGHRQLRCSLCKSKKRSSTFQDDSLDMWKQLLGAQQFG